ncbi:MAG: type II/IV secretion system ATPase subunit [Candidatus Aenigmatarchaeota archaeon]
MADENPENKGQPQDQNQAQPAASSAPAFSMESIGEGIERIKAMRGALYRAIMEQLQHSKEEEARLVRLELPLPGFNIKNIKRTAEFPKFDDISQVDVTYPLIEPFAYANIKWDPVDKVLVYNVVQPQLDDKDRQMLKKIASALIELVEVELTSIKEEGKVVEYLEKQIAKIIRQFGLDIPADRYARIMYFIYRNFVGFNEIEPFLQDPNIEDISCDGTGAPMYVVHRKFGSIKTNVVIDDLENLREFVIKIAERTGRYVSYAEPVLEGTLPDGSRVSATLAGDVATRGPTFTIRKFSERPFSPIDVMNVKTASAALMSYFWYLIEYGASILVVGGVATGKTSFLNSLCMFIPPEAKIVSIEDTRELRIPNEHWVPTLARVGFGIPMPSGEKYGGVSLFDLLKQSFRQNPDYVIVGETRGKEAYVMFQGMSSGHPSMSTFHAGSVDAVIKRLTTSPIDLSPTLIESLNVIVVMVHAREKGKSARRVKQIAEVLNVDAKTGEVKTNIVFTWDPVSDTFVKVNESVTARKLVEAKGGTAEQAMKEMEVRTRVLEWMRAQGITDYTEVTKIINRYYKEPNILMEQMAGFLTPKDAELKVVKPLQAELPQPRPEPKAGEEEQPAPAEVEPQPKPQPQIQPPVAEPARARPKARAKPFKFLESDNPLDAMAKAGSEQARLAAGDAAENGKHVQAETSAERARELPGNASMLGLFNLRFVKDRAEQLKRELARI